MQEGSPSLAGGPPSFDHVLGDARLRDLEPELELKGRIRRITIVAVARKLLIALWRYLENGQVPEGAILKVK